jgi:uncharacterized membrane protein YuzA (DUF378 family)
LDTLPRNTADWDRSLRFGLVLALFGVLPVWIRNPYLLIAGGIVAGFQLLAAFTGF